MKRKLGNFMQLGILTALGLSVLLSIFIQEISWPSTSWERLEISIIFREWNTSAWGELRFGMEKAASDYGAELRFLTPQESNSAAEQQKLVEQEVNNGADGLVIIPASGDVQQQITENKLTIPYVIMESDGDEKTSGFTPDSETIGQLLAQAATEDFPNGATALLINPLPENTGIQKRLDPVQKYLSENGFSILTADTDNWARLLLDADFVILPETTSAIQMMAFLEEQQLDIPLYAVGYSQETVNGLEDGTIRAAVVWNGYGEGYLAIQQIASRLLKTTPPESEPAVILVRKEDMYEPESQKILFPIGN